MRIYFFIVMSEFIGAIAFIITALLGPGMFYVLSSHTKGKIKRYPVGLIDGIGDLLFLPFLNGALFYYGFSFEHFVTAVIPAISITLGYYFYRKDAERLDDWTRPKLHQLSAGGYYHLTYFLIQSFMIFTALTLYFDKLLIWLPLWLYLLTVLYTYNKLRKNY